MLDPEDLRNARRNWEYNPGPESPQMTRQRWIDGQKRRQLILDISFVTLLLCVLWLIFGTHIFDFLLSD